MKNTLILIPSLMLVSVELVTRSVIVTHWCGGMEWGHSDIVSGLTQYSTVVPLVQQLAGEVRARESRRMSEENCATVDMMIIITFRTSDLADL